MWLAVHEGSIRSAPLGSGRAANWPKNTFSHSGGSRYVQHRRAGTRIELRVYRLPVDLDRQDDLRSDVIDRLDIDFACALGCPVSQRLAAAILRLVQLDRVVGQIELDVCLVEKILAEDEGDVATEISFPCDYHPPILARDLADLDLIYIDGLNLGFAADELTIRLRSANVTSRIALATATPTAMIAPIND